MKEKLNHREVRKQRLVLGQTSVAMSRAARINRSLYSLWENGHGELTTAQTVRLRAAMDRLLRSKSKTISELVTEHEQRDVSQTT
jgi:hypothetical protein